MPALYSAPVCSCKHVMGCPSLSFTTVEDDTDIAPVLKVSAQFFVQVQTAAGHYEEEHAYVRVGRAVTAGERASHHGIDGNLKRAGRRVNGCVFMQTGDCLRSRPRCGLGEVMSGTRPRMLRRRRCGELDGGVEGERMRAR